MAQVADAGRIEPRTSTWDMFRMALGMRRSTWREWPKAQHEGNLDGSIPIPRSASDMPTASLLDLSGVEQQLRLPWEHTSALPCAESSFATSFSPTPPRPRRTSAAPTCLSVTLGTCALNSARTQSQFTTPQNTNSITHSLSWVTSTTYNPRPCERRGSRPVRLSRAGASMHAGMSSVRRDGVTARRHRL
jgi:hypothetical protein